MRLHFLAAFSGVSFTLIGVAYRLGQSRRVTPLQIVLICTGAGAVVFGACAIPSWPRHLPLAVMWGAALAGLTQYATARLIRPILDRGPLSPLVCATALAFLPATVYARFALGEGIHWTQHLGILAGIACVLAASFQQDHTSKTKHARGSRAVYALLLLTLFIVNSVSYVVLKDLSVRTAADGRSYLSAYRDTYLFAFYLWIAVPVLLDVWLTRGFRAPVRPWLALGLPAAVGSMGGMWAIAVASQLPAAVVYTLSNITSLVAGSTISVMFFHEKATKAWYAMLALGVAAVALVNLHALWRACFA